MGVSLSLKKQYEERLNMLVRVTGKTRVELVTGAIIEMLNRKMPQKEFERYDKALDMTAKKL